LTTVAEAITEGAARLRQSGVSEGRRTAGLLLGHALGLDRAGLLVRSGEQVGEADRRAYLGFVERRASGEPLQYITGRQEFYGLDFKVTKDVLIPRPETEFLVENVINLARGLDGDDRELIILDVGTGSGCIAVTLAVHVPRARVIATDISGRALDEAREHAGRHGVADLIEFVEGDLLEPLKAGARGAHAGGLEGRVDFLASNPPYVPACRPDLLQREVREWEPGVALFGGPEGVDFYKRLFADGRHFVRRGGYLVCEIGYAQLDRVRGMIDPLAWELAEVADDLQGIPRTLILRRV
jgi:release factor glutamine methyltransferase